MQTVRTKDKQNRRIEDRRKAARYRLILRAGVLEQEGKTCFCLVKNISTSGVQIKFYTRPVLAAAAMLRVADEQPVSGRIAWIKHDTAGISFDEDLDADALLRVQQKLRPNRRRAFPRVTIEATALLRIHGRPHAASVSDISSIGARIRTQATISAGDRALVELVDLPSIAAYVRWADSGEAGLAFETPIPMQIIAHWIDGSAQVSG